MPFFKFIQMFNLNPHFDNFFVNHSAVRVVCIMVNANKYTSKAFRS